MPLLPLVDEPRVVSPALFDQLPTEADAPPGLRLTEEHARSAGTIAAGFADVAEAERLFQAWGWRESAARVFAADTPTADGLIRFEVSAFRLADAAAAAEALPYFLDGRAVALGLPEVPAPPAGDEARAIAGPIEGGFEETIYVRQGAILFRITFIGEAEPGSGYRASEAFAAFAPWFE